MATIYSLNVTHFFLSLQHTYGLCIAGLMGLWFPPLIIPMPLVAASLILILISLAVILRMRS